LKKLLIGPLVPPIGGVATHISRYSALYGTPVIEENDIRSMQKAIKIFLLKDTEIYIHSSSYYITFLLLVKRAIFRRGCKIFLVNHNFQSICNYKQRTKYRLLHFMHYRLVHRCEAIYAVSQEIIDKMEGIYGKATYILFDPFVPPDVSTESRIIETYEPEVLNFIKTHALVLCSGAWHISFHNGADLYGFDLLIELIERIKDRIPGIGLVFFIGNPTYNEEYIKECMNRIERFGISENIQLVTGQKEMWPIIKRSDLFIRATNTDGDPISIKEALFLHTPVLASDCVKRIDEVELFKNRNIDSLEIQTLRMLRTMEFKTK